MPGPTFPERSQAIRRATALLCLRLGWSPIHEVPLPNSRRADIIALRPDGGFACIEIKSGLRDLQTDEKWPEYREYADALYFAVDDEFPLAMLPTDTGVIVACAHEAELVRESPIHLLTSGRRRAMLQRFAVLAAQRLAAREDPTGTATLRAALLAE